MSTMTTLVRRFTADDSGASLVEYGMLVLLIAVVVIGAVTTLGTKINTGFGKVNTALPN